MASASRASWDDRRSKSVLGDSKALRESKTYRKWDSMIQRGLEGFYASHPQTFLRRLRRGAPQDFRWEIWKTLLQSKSCNVSIDGISHSVSQTPDFPSASRETVEQATTTTSNLCDLDLETVKAATVDRTASKSRLLKPPSGTREDSNREETDSSYIDLQGPPSSSLHSSSPKGSPASPKRVCGFGCYASSSRSFQPPQPNSQQMCSLSNLTMREYLDLAEKPSPFQNLINIDIPRTFPEIPAFDSLVQRQLARILNAFANYRPVVGYCQGMNFVAGFLLLVSDFREFEVFAAMLIFFGHYGVEGLFRENFPLLSKYIEVYSAVASDTLPALWDHFNEEGVLPPVYIHQWFLTLFVRGLPLRTTVVIWDFLFAEGLSGLIPLTVALLKVLQRFLLRLKFEDAVKFLKSLKNSGDCDETEIGRMLVRQAERVEIPMDLMEPLEDIDIEELVKELEEERKTTQPSSFGPPSLGLDQLEVEAGNKPNPLLEWVNSGDKLQEDEEEEEDKEYHYIESSRIIPTQLLNRRGTDGGQRTFSILTRTVTRPKQSLDLSAGGSYCPVPVPSVADTKRRPDHDPGGHASTPGKTRPPPDDPGCSGNVREYHHPTSTAPATAHASPASGHAHASPQTAPSHAYVRTFGLGYPASSAWASSGYRGYRSLSRSLYYYPSGYAPLHVGESPISANSVSCHNPPTPQSSTSMYQSPLWRFSCSSSPSYPDAAHSSLRLLSAVEPVCYRDSYAPSSLTGEFVTKRSGPNEAMQVTNQPPPESPLIHLPNTKHSSSGNIMRHHNNTSSSNTSNQQTNPEATSQTFISQLIHQAASRFF